MIKLSNDTRLGTLIENQFGDNYLFSVNRRKFEQLDYQTQFNKEFEQAFNKEDTLYLITGTDSGMMVKQLLTTPPKKGSTYLFIDFPEIIQLTKSHYDLGTQKRIIVTSEDKWQEEASKIGMDTYFMINKVERIKSFAAQYYYLNEYLFLWQAIEDSANHLSWQYQSQLGSKNFVQKQLENLAENHTPAIVLKDLFKGKSALILAGGPSLDNYIDWIEENQQYYVVIAVTRIARRLLQTKIKPDIFVSVDPYPSNFSVSKEVFNFEQDSLLVHQFHLSPMILGNWLGVNLYLGELFPWKCKLNKDNLAGIGPTVTNSAIRLAIDMGIKQQILFGVDLCYSPEGYTHAQGSLEHDAGPEINAIGQTITTNKGDKAETNSAYYDAVTSIELLAELANTLGGCVYNPSPDSAKMRNVEHVLIDEIIPDKEFVSISSFLTEQLKHQQQSDFKIKHYQSVLKELNSAQFKIKKIEVLANKGLQYNKKFFAGDDPTANFKFKLKMDKLEKELNHKNLAPFSDLSKKMGINEFLQFIKPENSDQWTKKEIKESGDIYYKALKSGAILLLKNIFAAINCIEVRMIEQGKLITSEDSFKRHLLSYHYSTFMDDKPEHIDSTIYENKHILDDNYNSDEERILALNFRILHLQMAMKSELSRISLLDKKFSKSFKSMDSIIISGKTVDELKTIIKGDYLSVFKKPYAELDNGKSTRLDRLEIKLYNLFMLKDKDSLKRIYDGLLLLNIENKDSYIHLTQGYLYELENKIPEAVNEYQYASHEKTIESALKRLSAIALKQGEFENAHTSLLYLSDISYDYLPQLADFYKITKHYKDSFDTYTKYLEYVPNDITTLIKMGKLYQEQEIHDGAKFIYDEILKIDPENKIALNYSLKTNIKG